ncbi:MAG: zinc ribbon domain-containing protein [Candidatus Sulfotelmatobacter sp.]
MFCDGCGATIRPDQAFCSSCGKQITGSLAMMPQRFGRVQEHLNLLGILWLAFSAFNSIGGILILLANALFFRQTNMPPFLHPLFTGIGWFVISKSAVGLAAGFGLFQRELWARTLALILAFIALFTNIPFGTALGVYTMWVLLPRESEQEYGALAAARAA